MHTCPCGSRFDVREAWSSLPRPVASPCYPRTHLAVVATFRLETLVVPWLRSDVAAGAGCWAKALSGAMGRLSCWRKLFLRVVAAALTLLAFTPLCLLLPPLQHLLLVRDREGGEARGRELRLDLAHRAGCSRRPCTHSGKLMGRGRRWASRLRGESSCDDDMLAGADLCLSCASTIVGRAIG